MGDVVTESMDKEAPKSLIKPQYDAYKKLINETSHSVIEDNQSQEGAICKTALRLPL